MSDPFNLQRFVQAQDPVIDRVREELRRGHKTSHWMWFVFPQIAGLGSSAMAQRYAIASLAEARAYLAHPMLGSRLRECTELVLAAPHSEIGEILPYPDDLKFRSSMTLFSRATEDNAVFERALAKFFPGGPDPETLRRL